MENRFSGVSILKSAITIALSFASITAFPQFYENFDATTKAGLTSVGWGYYPTNGISLVSNTNAYSGKSLFTNAGSGNYEIVASPCLTASGPKDTLEFYYNFITVTGAFNIGFQNATASVPSNVTWIDSVYVSGWQKIVVPFNPPNVYYRVIFNMNTPGASFDKFGIDEVKVRHSQSLGTCLLVPVQLTSFTAVPVNSSSNNNFQVELNWETATEHDVNHYEIQRSFDGASFETVGSVQASGYSNSALTYSYTDEVSATYQCFYRLVTFDNNGTSSTSEIERVTFPTANSWYYSTGTLYYAGAESTTIEVYSLSGSKVIGEAVAGSSQIDLSQLPAGLYLVKTAADLEWNKIMVN